MAKTIKKELFNPLVSIVIPVYNGSNYLREAIDSALAQTYKNIEIIVVNDGSTDNTEEIVKSYGKKLRYFKKENGGVSTALNLGIKESKGEYISWLSHDDLYYPNKIEKQINKLSDIKSENRNITIIFSHFDALVMDSGKRINNFEKILYKNMEDPYYTYSMLDCFFSSKLNGCTLLLPRCIFEKFGFFDLNRKTIQDYILFITFFKCGIKYIFLDEVLVISRHHKEQDTSRKMDIHLCELNFLYKWAFDLFKDKFQEMPMWQFNHFLKIVKKRGLDKVYTHMLSGWACKQYSKNKINIWMYWENELGKRTPDYIYLCWKSIINYNCNDFNIKILTDDDIDTFLPKINKKYLSLSKIAHKADYIRFNLLYRYGGIWLDSDFVSFRSLLPVVEKINKNGFVCMGYQQKNRKFFPLIGFLGTKSCNPVFKKVILNIDNYLNKKNNIREQPKWDEIGGLNLGKYINNKNCYKYDSSFFCPHEVQFHGSVPECFNSNDNFSLFTLKNNQFAFGQNIANSVLSEEIKNMTEDEIISSKSFIGDLLRFGVSTNYPIVEFNSVSDDVPMIKSKVEIRKMYSLYENTKLSLKRKIKDYILISFYKVDKIVPKKIRRKVKPKLIKYSFVRKYLIK